MKKIISLMSVIVILLTFSGCGNSKSNIVPITKNISFDCDFQYSNYLFKGKVDIDKTGDMVISTTYPEASKGLVMEFKKRKLYMKYQDLEYEFTDTSMPEGVICTYLYDIFSSVNKEDCIVKEENDAYFIEGKPSFKLYVGGTGLPLQVEDFKTGFKATFKNVTIT